MKTLWALVFCLLASTAEALPVRILYDNSGSMYPGYRPPGSPDRRSREQLGVHFFHQSPQFAPWLDDFVRRQSALEADNVGMWTFTSNGAFTPADIHEVHPVVAVRDFRADTAMANFPQRTGNSTYLTETLQEFTHDYTGIVWLITDNIVETTAGEPDAGVQRFFETLAQTSEIRSVHLFKHSFEENSQSATLAVYGILVSTAEMPEQTIAGYDGKFRELFPGREHLKLKNLSIEPVTLHADLQLVLENRDKGLFEEGQSVKLELAGEIRSRPDAALRYRGPLRAGSRVAVPAGIVGAAGPRCRIAPFSDLRHGRRRHSRGDPAQRLEANPGAVELRSPCLVHSQQRRRVAAPGMERRGRPVHGAVRMSLSDVQVRLQRQQMAGIFGIDHASSIFAFQDVRSLSGIRPSVVPVSFALRTGSSRTAILLAVMGVLGVIAVAAAFVLSRKQTFRVAIANGPETITALRRLGTHSVMYEGQMLGRLSRGLVNSYAFHAAKGNPAFTVVPAGDGETWDVKFTGGPSRRLSIKAEGRRAVQKRPKPNAPATRAGPPPLPPLSRTAPPPGRPPKIGR